MSVASCISQWHLVPGLSVQTRELHGDRGSGKNSMEKWGMWGSTQETIRFWQKSGSCYVKIGVGLRFWLGPRHTPLYWVCSIQCLPNSDSYGGSVASAEVCTRLSAILISALISMHLSRCLKQALVQMSTFPLILHESYEIFHNHPLQEGEIIGGEVEWNRRNTDAVNLTSWPFVRRKNFSGSGWIDGTSAYRHIGMHCPPLAVCWWWWYTFCKLQLGGVIQHTTVNFCRVIGGVRISIWPNCSHAVKTVLLVLYVGVHDPSHGEYVRLLINRHLSPEVTWPLGWSPHTYPRQNLCYV